MFLIESLRRFGIFFFFFFPRLVYTDNALVAITQKDVDRSRDITRPRGYELITKWGTGKMREKESIIKTFRVCEMAQSRECH